MATITTTSDMVENDMAHDMAELRAAALGKACDCSKPCESGMMSIDENGVEHGSSRPPSPPSTGSNTPTLTIAPCPERFWPFVPPPQYGVVEDYTIFRSSYPQDRNMDFIRSLDIKSILTLVETEASPGYLQWIEDYGIKQGKVTIAPNKDAKEGKAASSTSLESICEAVIFAMDGANHPLWIHCNQGRHRTGCVVACMRKIQGMPIKEIIREYVAYASPKERLHDIAFIEAFQPSVVFDYALEHGIIGGPNAMVKPVGLAPISNVYELAHALAMRKRQDSVNSGEIEPAVESLSAHMSEASITTIENPALEDASNKKTGEEAVLEPKDPMTTIDPMLLNNGNVLEEHTEVEVVEVGDVLSP